MERGLRFTIAALIAVGAVARLAPLFDHGGRLFEQFPTEDAYLVFTVARNLALGHGLSVSDGTVPANAVQPLATFLWSACFWIVGGARKTGVLLVLVVELAIGAASALGLWQLAQRALARTRHAELAAMLAAAAWWASPAAIPHAMNGLETGLCAGGVILVALAFIAPGTEGAWALARQLRFGLALGLAFLARYDAFLLIACACLVHLGRPVEGRGRAPLRRFGEALVFGAVSVAVAAPWLAFSYVSTGRVVPFSGPPQPLDAQVAQSLGRAATALVELAFMLAPIPRAAREGLPAIAAASLLCVVGLAAAVAAWWRTDATRRALIGLGTLFTLSLGAFHGLYFRAGDSIGRLLYPVSPFLAIAWAGVGVALLARAEARVPAWLAHAALAGVLALALAGNAQSYANGAAHAHFQVVEWVDVNVSDDVWVGARHSGTLGFFHDRTLGLGGKRGALVDFILAKRPPYIADWAGAVDLLHEQPLAARYEVLVHDPEQNLDVLRLKSDAASGESDAPE